MINDEYEQVYFEFLSFSNYVENSEFYLSDNNFCFSKSLRFWGVDLNKFFKVA